MHPRYLYRKIRSALASNLILPRFVIDNYALTHHVTRQRPHMWFETSRHVLEYSGSRSSKCSPRRIVCYVFAPEHSEASDRFFWWFVTDPLLTEPNTFLYDEATDLVLKSVLTHSASRARWYCEIVIAPPALIVDSVDADTLAISIKNRAALQAKKGLLQSLPYSSVGTDMDVNSHAARNDSPSLAGELPLSSPIEITDEHSRRANLDWSFVMDQIHLAIEKGRALDDTTIRVIAQRRLEYASQEYSYPDSAGATQESSEDIVHGIVDLYRLGTEPDFVPSTHPEHS